MKSFASLLALFAIGSTVKVQGAELVVMATNTTSVPGDKVYTIGVQVSQADIDADIAAAIANGTSANVPLGIQQLAFQGNVVNLDQTTPYDPTEIQDIQSQYIDNATKSNPVAPAFGAGPPGDLGTAGDAALYDSSWWYFGSKGKLTGTMDSTGTAGTVTTNPAADGSGVYTIGPTNNVGPTGALWQPIFTNNDSIPQPPGMSMIAAFYGGLYPPAFINEPPYNGLFVNGSLTVPLAQVVASGDVTIPFELANPPVSGAQGFISVGPYVTQNFLGGSGDVDPHAVLDFSTNTIHSELTSGDGLSSPGGVQVNPSMITGDGNLSSTYSTTTVDGLGQVIGETATQQINFALPGSTVQSWDIQFSGTLAGPSSIVLHYDPTLLGITPESQLRIEHYENGQWIIPAGQVVDTSAHTITFQTDGFSPFVLSQVPEPASGIMMAVSALGLVALRKARRYYCACV